MFAKLTMTTKKDLPSEIFAVFVAIVMSRTA